MRLVVLIAAGVFLLCTAARFADVAVEMTDEISAFVDLAKDISGIVLAVATLYLWLPRRGRATEA